MPLETLVVGSTLQLAIETFKTLRIASINPHKVSIQLKVSTEYGAAKRIASNLQKKFLHRIQNIFIFTNIFVLKRTLILTNSEDNTFLTRCFLRRIKLFHSFSSEKRNRVKLIGRVFLPSYEFPNEAQPAGWRAINPSASSSRPLKLH